MVGDGSKLILRVILNSNISKTFKEKLILKLRVYLETFITSKLSYQIYLKDNLEHKIFNFF